MKLFVAVMVGVMVLGTVGFMAVEGLDLGDAAYFSLVSITTVGYGDITPRTPWGKFLAMVVIIAGVGTFTGLLATVTDALLGQREKRLRDEKLNTMIGLFFSEVGIGLLGRFLKLDPLRDELQREFQETGDWTEAAFEAASGRLRSHDFGVSLEGVDLSELRDELEANRGLFIRLLENPYLSERGRFSDLLRAVLHLREELVHRGHLDRLSWSDQDHLGGDIKRVYASLVTAWLDYMRYLKENYAYLYSLAARRNPFSGRTTVEVE